MHIAYEENFDGLPNPVQLGDELPSNAWRVSRFSRY
jgi:hypothetical protein